MNSAQAWVAAFLFAKRFIQNNREATFTDICAFFSMIKDA
jgi:hypothetical protein